MDALGDFLPILIFFVLIVIQAARRVSRSARSAPEAPTVRTRSPRETTRGPSRGTAGPTPFEQLLARLEQETAGSPATPSPTRVPEARREFARTETPPVRPPEARRPDNAMFAENRAAFARDRERTAQATAFHSLEAQRPEPTRGFETETRGFERERFEHERHGFGSDNPLSEVAFSQARDADRRPAPASRPGYDPHGLARTPAPRPAPRFGAPGALREAFVLSTILGRRPPLRRPTPPSAGGSERDAGA